ncbi:MAG: argininosuccinate lyase, partial [bacterium]
MKKVWQARFSKDVDKLVEEFTASISFDARLYKYDIIGSIAHTKMLAKCKIILQKECNQIIKGLKEIEKEIEKGIFKFSLENEDIHSNIEIKLIEKIGEVGKKLHTARSRNDQVVLDIRLFLKDEIKNIVELIQKIQDTLLSRAQKDINVIMPGYTHLQHAQPISLAHYWLSHITSFERDTERLKEVYKRTNILPLGVCALAGTSFSIDRNFVAKELNFSAISENSLDTVSDRDFMIEFLNTCAIIMMHLSRFSEDLIIWSTIEFNFIELDDSFCTGSSIMPHKKNPDILELIRGKTGRVYGNLISLLTLLKGLPSSYNRDLQEDKIPLFDTIDITKNSLLIYSKIFETMKINSFNMEQMLKKGFSTSSEISDYLTKKGVPFRKSYQICGEIVKYCLRKK